MSISTRPATLHDLPTLLSFEQGMILAERPFDPTIKEEDTYYYDLESMISSPDVELIVAESGNEIIASGYARIERSKPFLKHSQHAYLGFMYVIPSFRGKGVNKIIIDALTQWASSRNITEIRLEVYYENAAAIRAYEKAGFGRYMVQMRKENKSI